MCFKYIWKTIFNSNITNFSWIRLCFWRGITRKVCRKQVEAGFSKFTELDGIRPYWYEFIMTCSISYDNSKKFLFEMFVISYFSKYLPMPVVIHNEKERNGPFIIKSLLKTHYSRVDIRQFWWCLSDKIPVSVQQFCFV